MKARNWTTIGAVALLLAGCVNAPQPAPRSPQVPASQPRPVPRLQLPGGPLPAAPVEGFLQPEIIQGPGLSGIVRADVATLERRFGTPRLTVNEGDMVKLQFAGEPCVLDIFLYPLAPGATPVATWVEARRASDGAAVDRAACIAALQGRR